MMRTKSEIDLQLLAIKRDIGVLAHDRARLDARTHEYRALGKRIDQLIGWTKALEWVLNKQEHNKP